MSCEVKQAMLTFLDFFKCKGIAVTEVRMSFSSMMNALVCARGSTLLMLLLKSMFLIS